MCYLKPRSRFKRAHPSVASRAIHERWGRFAAAKRNAYRSGAARERSDLDCLCACCAAAGAVPRGWPAPAPISALLPSCPFIAGFPPIYRTFVNVRHDPPPKPPATHKLSQPIQNRLSPSHLRWRAESSLSYKAILCQLIFLCCASSARYGKGIGRPTWNPSSDGNKFLWSFR